MSLKNVITTCPLDCFDACSLVVTVEDDGRITKIEGNKEHPITKGFICEKGKKHLERVYHTERLKYPMLKKEGKWERITWDKAYDIISDRMKEYIENYGMQSIASYTYSGSAGILKNIEDMFFEFMGGTTRIYGSICWGAGMSAQKADFGRVLSHKPEDMMNSKTIVIWGRNPVDTNIHLVPYIKKAKDNGAKVILIDPLKTASADLCDKHIAVKPEGDAAFACATAKYMLEKNKYDKYFMQNCTLGFDEIKSFLKGKSMPEFSELCGVSEVEIVEFAEQLINFSPASVYIGYGLQRYPYGGTMVRCIDMLVAISGNIGVPGGGANYANDVSDGYMDFRPRKKMSDAPPRLVNRAMFGKMVKELNDPPVKMLFVSRANPVTQLPNTNEVIEAIESIEFKVVLEHFMTDTAEMADIVLPAAYFLEEEDINIPHMLSSYVGYVNKCKERYYEAKPEFEIYTELAEIMGYEDFPKLNERQWMKLLMKPLTGKGLDLNELKRLGYVKNPLSIDIPWADKKFNTASGKFELIEVEKMEECLRNNSNGQAEGYRLLTVHYKKSLHSQHIAEAKEDFPIVYINPSDAMHEGIANKEVIKLFNKYGDVYAEVSISESGTPGVIYMNEGWWLKNGGSVNRLTKDGISDIGNQGIFNHCFCKIEKVKVN
ncbi:MAG: molybdopterin-containing oxidoreductase family protein [Caulobacteraceae bacterium]